MATTGFIEREVKLHTELAFALPDLRDVVGRSVRKPSQELTTTYYDTPDFRLWDRGITLRHRAERDSEEGTWTVKLPSDGAGAHLERQELSWPGHRDSVPLGATSVLRGVVRRSTLEPVAELLTTRRRFIVGRAEESAELDDDIVTVMGAEGAGARRFRQLEVEFGTYGEEVGAKVVRALRRAGARVEHEPKLAKALDLKTRQPHRLNRHASLGNVLRTSIANGYERLLDHDSALRVDPANPPPRDVHQARVATRRLRSDLKTFRDVIDPVWLDHTRAELQWLGTVLGEARDLDVLYGHLTDDLNNGSPTWGGQELLAVLVEQRRAASRQLAAALSTDRYLDLLDRLHAGAEMPPFYQSPHVRLADSRRLHPDVRASQALPKLVDEQWRRARRRTRKAGRHPSDRDLHRIRIGAKQLRYAAEMAEPVVGARARRTAKAAENVQTVLGDYHDTVSAKQWLELQVSSPFSAIAFAAGRFWAEQDRQQRKLGCQWRSTWADLDQKKVLDWLT